MADTTYSGRRRRGRHAAPAPTHTRLRGVAAGVVLATAVSTGAAAVAWADPDQPGVTDTPGTSSQGGGDQTGVTGTTPTPAPAPTPAPTGPSVIPAPTYDVPPVYVSPSVYNNPPANSGAYNPIPERLHAPRPVTPVRPVIPTRLPRPGQISLSSNVSIPQGPLSDADARNLNAQFAVAQAKLDTFYRSIGFTDDQATRSATATILGGAAGATAAGLAVFIPTEIVLGGGGALACGLGGAAIGSAFPTPPVSTAIGAGIGAAACGAAGTAAATGLGLAAAAAGGAVGAGLGFAFGAGDRGGDPNGQIGGPTTEDPRLSQTPPPHPEANQYELSIGQGTLPGNASVDYTVNSAGDVSGSITAGPVSVPIAVSHEQSQGALAAAGPLSRTVGNAITDTAVAISEQAAKAIPGVKVSFPQFGTGAQR